MLGRSILELIHEEDLSTLGVIFQEGIVEDRKDARVEYRVRNKNGSFIWVETIGTLIIDASGQPSGALFTSRDISERKQAEEALRLSEEKYRQITDNMSDVVWIIDMNLRTIYVSPSFERVVGESVHVHMNRALEEKHPPEVINLLISTIQEEIEKESDPSLDKNRSRSIDVEYYKVDGSTIWLSMHISAVRDREGSIIGFQGLTLDITDRKKAELDLIESENKFKTLFQDSLVSIIVFDIDTGEIIYANETAWESYGLDSLTELQKNDFWMEPPYSAKESLEWIHKTVNEGVQVFEWKNCIVTGEIFWEQVMVRPTIINGIERIISSVTDITDRKQAKEALIQSEEKYKNIAENMSDVVWTTDAELNTVYISPSVEKLIGESVDCRMNRSLEERFPADSLNKLLNTFKEEIEKDKGSLSGENRSRIIEVQ